MNNTNTHDSMLKTNPDVRYVDNQPIHITMINVF